MIMIMLMLLPPFELSKKVPKPTSIVRFVVYV